MRITAYILATLLLTVLAGCSRDASSGAPEPKGVSLRLTPGSYATKVIDADNLAVEQTINDLTVFLTLPSSDAITHSYVHPGFTANGEYRIVSLPEEAAELQTRDIYVVANCDAGILEGITTITALREAQTPHVGKNDNLDPAKGLCMYGKLAGFDFVTATDPPIVDLERTCNKLRVNLRFPDDPALSIENTFLITNAAAYTHITDDTPPLILTSDDYFNFAAPLPLTDNGTGGYTGLAYVYEASQVPQLYIYTHINGSAQAQEFIARLPLPLRNYLFDINVSVYYDLARSASPEPSLRYEMTVTAYDAAGNRVEL